jgi:hypothetical protein
MDAILCKKCKASYSRNNNMQKVPLIKEKENIRHLMYCEQWILLRHTNSRNKRKEKHNNYLIDGTIEKFKILMLYNNYIPNTCIILLKL